MCSGETETSEATIGEPRMNRTLNKQVKRMARTVHPASACASLAGISRLSPPAGDRASGYSPSDSVSIGCQLSSAFVARLWFSTPGGNSRQLPRSTGILRSNSMASAPSARFGTPPVGRRIPAWLLRSRRHHDLPSAFYLSAKNTVRRDGTAASIRIVANLQNAYSGAMPRVVYESAQTTGR